MSGSKTDALPKRGHVNEVCKEWLVREDGALAYKLQSQEINEFYKGNRYRNEVVRTDFPTALNEQIKEKENAQKQTEHYKRYLSEQEEHDKRVAMEIAEKLEKDLMEQRQREFQESEEMADKLQNIYVNLPPPGMPEVQTDSYFENASISNAGREFTQEVGLPMNIDSLNLRTENLLPSKDHQQKIHKSKQIFNSRHDTHDGLHFSNKNINRSKHQQVQHGQQSLPVDTILQYTHSMEHSASAISDPLKPSSHNHQYKNNVTKRPTYENFGDTHVKGDFNSQVMSQDSDLQYRRHQMQEHVDEIELYIDPNLQEIGLPMEEIKEMKKKIKQEKKDEELAKRLQEMEKLSGLTLEDRDRLLAIEAQDKELAKMLQEREKAKAKRAKEKARLRKHQYQKESNGMHTGPLQPLPQEFAVSSSAGKPEEVDQIDLDAYSNPKDLITHQRIHTESVRGNSVHSTLEHVDNSKDDDIYTLPIDSCGPNRSTSESSQNHSLTRSESSHHEMHDSLRMTHSMSNSYEQSSSPAPPYMPIQGTRRSNSNEERKKRSKDKCTHQ